MQLKLGRLQQEQLEQQAQQVVELQQQQELAQRQLEQLVAEFAQPMHHQR
jgi:hypothetical protein